MKILFLCFLSLHYLDNRKERKSERRLECFLEAGTLTRACFQAFQQGNASRKTILFMSYSTDSLIAINKIINATINNCILPDVPEKSKYSKVMLKSRTSQWAKKFVPFSTPSIFIRNDCHSNLFFEQLTTKRL